MKKKKNSLDILPCLTIQTILLDFAELLVHSVLSCKQFLVLLVSGVAAVSNVQDVITKTNTV